MTKKAAQQCFDRAGLKPTDVDVIELHDCFSVNEFITYEALGLCPEGKAAMEIIVLLKWKAPKIARLRTPVISVLGSFFGAVFYHNLNPRFPSIYVFCFKKIKIG